MSDTLDLAPLEEGLDRLLAATSGENLAPAFLREGEELARQWQGEVRSEGLILTGAYLDSIRAREAREGPGSARVLVGTDLGYPNVLEYGDRFISPHPVGHRAYAALQDQLIAQLSADIAAAVEEA